MEYMDTALDVGNLASSVAQLAQSETHHRKELEMTKAMHEASMALAQKQHAKDMQTGKRIYLMETFTDLEQHFQQLNNDLMSSNRESESDMFDQCNQSLQTVLLGNCIMFGTLSTVIFQGFICGTPEMNSNLVACTEVDPYVFILYSSSSALSFAFLFLSIVLCVEVILLSTKFMYNRANDYIKLLRYAMHKTKEMMAKIRYRQQQQPPTSSERMAASGRDVSGRWEASGRDVSGRDSRDEATKMMASDMGRSSLMKALDPVPSSSSSLSKKREGTRFATMNEEELNERWVTHEEELHTTLEQRNEIIKEYLTPGGKRPGRGARSSASAGAFSKFWSQTCESKQRYAVWFFYLGTACMLVAMIIFCWILNLQTYLSLSAAALCVAILGAFLAISLWLAIFLRFYDKGSHVELAGRGGAEEVEEEVPVDDGDDSDDDDDDDDSDDDSDDDDSDNYTDDE